MIETLFALLVLAQPVSRYTHVPDPIPLDFNQCVQVVWTKEGRAKYKGTDIGIMGEMTPPIPKTDLAYLEYWRKEGLAVLQLCHNRAS